MRWNDLLVERKLPKKFLWRYFGWKLETLSLIVYMPVPVCQFNTGTSWLMSSVAYRSHNIHDLSPDQCQTFGVPVGIESGAILDTALTSSTCYSSLYCTQHARLNGASAWLPNALNQNQWLQVSFDSRYLITSIITQGRSGVTQWVTSYTLSYSTNNLDWSENLDEYSGAVKVIKFSE